MQPQTCTKCHSLPEDILMLSCSHDLCLNCASDRLAFEMKKKKPANSIVCEFCYERTPLDSQSVSELEKLIGTKGIKGVGEGSRLPQPKIYSKNPDLYDKSTKDIGKKDKYSYGQGIDKFQDKPKDRSYERGPSNVNYNPSIVIDAGRKQCLQHSEEEILYFCFDCKCQCICPQCVIHGKHKDHEVKTLKKAHPIVKGQLQKSLQKLQNNIEGLLIKKSEVQKNIRSLNEQTTQSKRQIQQAFEEIRHKLDNKEKQILKTCDQSNEQGLQELDKYIKGVMKRIEQIKIQSSTIQQSLKRDEITTLNYYSKKWKQISEEARQSDVHTNVVSFPSNQIILASVLDLTDQIAQIGLPPQQRNNKY